MDFGSHRAFLDTLAVNLFPEPGKKLPNISLEDLLDRLDTASKHFQRGQQRETARILNLLSRRKIATAESLIRFHELLLFICAYPQGARARQLAESLLVGFAARINRLRESNTDLSALGHPDVSGFAGTSVTDTFSYNIVSWLLSSHLSQVALDWEWFEDENRLASTWPRLMPLLEEDAFVEANVPYRKWLRAARNGLAELPWLIERFDRALRSNQESAELYDSLKLYVRWTPAYRASRTGMRLHTNKVFYHQRPLIQRREISFRDELKKSPPRLDRLSVIRGERILDMAREASTVRYRELYGFTHGDPKRVLKAHLGRGLDLFVMGVPPERRLPLRAYHAAMIFKNGVPVGYFEGLSLSERMESGFNFYYTFRDGETAWIYARTLNVFRHLLGVTAFSIDPYQIGYENEEGIESGAFWFYRKLGFRPTQPALLRITEREERKIAGGSSYRTPAAVLRKLAAGPMILELDQTKAGDWDRFQVRNIGLAVQREMGRRFRGEAVKIRKASVAALAEMLRIRLGNLDSTQMRVLEDFAVALRLIPDLGDWTRDEKAALLKVIQAKTSPDEGLYLKRMQKHARLRRELIKLGSV